MPSPALSAVCPVRPLQHSPRVYHARQRTLSGDRYQRLFFQQIRKACGSDVKLVANKFTVKVIKNHARVVIRERLKMKVQRPPANSRSSHIPLRQTST